MMSSAGDAPHVLVCMDQCCEEGSGVFLWGSRESGNDFGRFSDIRQRNDFVPSRLCQNLLKSRLICHRLSLECFIGPLQVYIK